MCLDIKEGWVRAILRLWRGAKRENREQDETFYASNQSSSCDDISLDDILLFLLELRYSLVRQVESILDDLMRS